MQVYINTFNCETNFQNFRKLYLYYKHTYLQIVFLNLPEIVQHAKFKFMNKIV